MATEEGTVAFLSQVAELLEGPYKWYVIGIVALILTAGITRFVFKTFKWFLLVMVLALILITALWALAQFAGVSLLPTLSPDSQAQVGE